MFSVLDMPILRFLPNFHLAERWRQRFAMHRNSVNPDEMTDRLRRDLGLLDGRDRRGAQDDGAFRAGRLIHLPRSL